MRRFNPKNDLEKLSAQINDIDYIFSNFDDNSWESARLNFEIEDALFKYAKYNLTELKEKERLLREEKISIGKPTPGRQETSIGKI